MFGMGGSEIIVILIVALLFLGPDKLPQAAKTISKGIRDIKKQSRSLQNQIESDEQIGGAIRDLKSALRGDEPAPRPKPFKPRTPKQLADPAGENSIHGGTTEHPGTESTTDRQPDEPPRLTMPATAGEPAAIESGDGDGADEQLAAMVRPASGTVAKGS